MGDIFESHEIHWDAVNKHPVKVPKEPELLISEELADIEGMLIGKNRAYGNSALEPVSFLSAANAAERLAVRIDDKLNRLYQGKEWAGDDTVLDLIGYLVLFRIAKRNE